MSGAELIALAGAGAVAGVVNAVAGGGTLITFPVLLAVGTPAILANATALQRLYLIWRKTCEEAKGEPSDTA